MYLRLKGHDFHYEAENLCRTFYPDEQIRIICDENIPDGESFIDTSLEGNVFTVSANINGTSAFEKSAVTSENDNNRNEAERILIVLIYKVLSEITGYCPPWGVLTGVRPSKLMNSYIELFGEDRAKEIFTEDLLVSKNKTDLASSVAVRESKIINLSRPDSFSLYISVPFCPSRCSYCSFVSHSITSNSAKKLIEPYVGLLLDEIKQCGEIAGDLSLRLESIYIGGGTPGILTAEQMTAVCNAIKENFDTSSSREFTVEIGRPDTVTKEKLIALKNADVSRISINPQTLNDEVLALIGRKHSSKETLDAFLLARKLGFDNINTDLIAGLDGDTPESFRNTLDGIIALSPENITVHTLSLKRSSSLASSDHDFASQADCVSSMLDDAQKTLTENSFVPYYMYRQSHCVGNFENVGWCKDSYECLYNIFMMEECHTVLACGAGAVTKLKQPHGGYIERVFNFKYPYEYIGRFDEMTLRKKRIKEFYSEYK